MASTVMAGKWRWQCTQCDRKQITDCSFPNTTGRHNVRLGNLQMLGSTVPPESDSTGQVPRYSGWSPPTRWLHGISHHSAIPWWWKASWSRFPSPWPTAQISSSSSREILFHNPIKIHIFCLFSLIIYLSLCYIHVFISIMNINSTT